LGFIGTVILAFITGKHKGWKNAEERTKETNAQAVQTRDKLHREIEKLTPDDTDKRISKWMRD